MKIVPFLSIDSRTIDCYAFQGKYRLEAKYPLFYDTTVPETEWVIHDPSERVQPSFYLNIEEAQSLMDRLWDCGLRPTEGKGSAGALAATQYHLEDMRKLVFERHV